MLDTNLRNTYVTIYEVRFTKVNSDEVHTLKYLNEEEAIASMLEILFQEGTSDCGTFNVYYKKCQ